MNKIIKSKSFPKIPVGDQPICTEQEYCRIDPLWLIHSVPGRYWENRENRRKYLLWLCYRLRCRKMRDIYRLTHEDVKRNRGGGVAGSYWRASLIEGVKECFPQYDWKEWLFVNAPREFWKDKKNHHRYMQWLGEQLGIRSVEDWYSVSTEDFQKHAGGSFLLCYRSSVSLAVKAFLPQYDWKEWMFEYMPKGFWDLRKNRRRYMRWLEKVLKIKNLDDWYHVSLKHFNDNYGREFIKRYHQVPALAVIDLIPRKNWYEWQFVRVPTGFWKKVENRRRYMQWLGKRLGFKRPEDWYRLRWQDVKNHCGGGLMQEFRSCTLLLRELLPQFNWDNWKRNSLFNDEQITQWAKDYLAKYGKWPNRDIPGHIPGTRKTWRSIHDYFRRRKSRSGTSRTLASFLKTIDQ